MTTGEKIKALRKARGLSQRQLAEKAGYANHTVLLKIENGTVDPPISRVCEIARALGVTLSDIAGDFPGTNTATVNLDDRNERLVEWFRSLPEEKQKAILVSQDAPEDVS